MMTSRQIPNTDSGTIVCSSTTFTKFIQDIDIEAIRALKRVGTYGHSQEILMSTWFKRASAFKKEVISLLGLPAGNKELVFDRAEYQAFCKEFQELLSKVEKPEYLDAADLVSAHSPLLPLVFLQFPALTLRSHPSLRFRGPRRNVTLPLEDTLMRGSSQVGFRSKPRVSPLTLIQACLA